MLTPSFKKQSRSGYFTTGARDFAGGELVGDPGRLLRAEVGGGGSKVQGKPLESIQRASATNSNPVNPAPDFRTMVNSFGELQAASVMVLPKCGRMASSHFSVGASVGGNLRANDMSQI